VGTDGREPGLQGNRLIMRAGGSKTCLKNKLACMTFQGGVGSREKETKKTKGALDG